MFETKLHDKTECKILVKQKICPNTNLFPYNRGFLHCSIIDSRLNYFSNIRMYFFQNISIIFFSAAKVTNERKISETSEEAAEEESNSDTESASSDLEDSDEEKYALKSTQEDLELFKKQIADLEVEVCNTSDRFDRIQEALDKVIENLKLGNPIERFPSQNSEDNVEETKTQESPEGSSEKEMSNEENKIHNSYEVFDRNMLLDVLRRQNIENKKNPPRLSVGMIGYPNVGKSSTVNILMQTKKV